MIFFPPTPIDLNLHCVDRDYSLTLYLQLLIGIFQNN